MTMDDPLRMYLVVLRGAVTDLGRAGALAMLRETAAALSFTG